MESLKFILVCLAIFAGLVLLAAALERWLVRDRKRLSDTHYIVYTAIFACMAGVLMLVEVPFSRSLMQTLMSSATTPATGPR